MAPYMMSVALWVGCIAFSLMYPLTKYSGKLKSGLAWWGSKASVLYLIALLQAAVMIFMLHLCDGGNGENPGGGLSGFGGFYVCDVFLYQYFWQSGKFPDAGIYGDPAGRFCGNLPPGTVRKLCPLSS